MLYKDVETRSKMNLMFLEQIKHQMTEQYVMNGMMNGGHLTHQQQQQQQQVHELCAGDPMSGGGGQQLQQPVQRIKTENHVNMDTEIIQHALDSWCVDTLFT